MVVDTSALMAILFRELEAAEFQLAMIRANSVRLSTANLIEAAAVARGRGGEALEQEFDVLLRVLRVEVVPQTLEQAALARSAFARFGKGINRARLNLFDCCAYALAMDMAEPLLFKGNDFSLTDVTPAV